MDDETLLALRDSLDKQEVIEVVMQQDELINTIFILQFALTAMDIMLSNPAAVKDEIVIKQTIKNRKTTIDIIKTLEANVTDTISNGEVIH
jgi:hypothetical protein